MTARLLFSVLLLLGVALLPSGAVEEDPPPAADPTPATRPATRPAPPFVRGVALSLNPYDHGYAAGYPELLGEIRDLGANLVYLVIRTYVDEVDSEDVHADPKRTASEQAIAKTLDQAERLGLRVALSPIVLIDRPKPDDWRGNLRPASWDAWFASYGTLLTGFAKVGAAHGADLLVVGSELASTEEKAAHWTDLIARVREVFPGLLLYSANWDHYEHVPFWDRLDLVGISSYYTISDEEDPSLEALEAGWAPIREKLAAWQATIDRPLLFTELGYPNRTQPAKDPWNYCLQREPAPKAHARCFDAWFRVWSEEAALGGVVIYDWTEDGGPDHLGYTPRGKPAQKVIRAWFSRLARLRS